MGKRLKNTKIFEKDFAAHELLDLDCYQQTFDKKISFITELIATATVLMLVVLLVVHVAMPKYDELVIKCIIIAIPCLTVALFIVYLVWIFIHNRLIINAETIKAATRVFHKTIDQAVQKCRNHNNRKNTFMGIKCVPEDVVNADYEDETEQPLDEDEEENLIEEYVSSENRLPLIKQQELEDDEDFDEEDEMSIEEILESVDRILNKMQGGM